MSISTGGVDKALNIHLNKIHKTNAIAGVTKTSGSDAVTISKFSALIEHGRSAAMALPDVRADRVSETRLALEMGDSPESQDIASAMINSIVGGQI